MQDGWSRLGPSMSRKRGTAPIDPLTLTSLRGFYVSDTGTTIVTGVSQWNDQSGAGNHLVQAVGASQPALTAGAINGFPALNFDGTDDSMQVAFALTQPTTIFLVMQNDTNVVNQDITDGITTPVSMALEQSGAGNMRIRAGALGTGVAAATGSFFLATCIFNGASSVLSINEDPGTEFAGNAGASAGDGLRLGGRQDASNFADCMIAEVAIMAAIATAAERAGYRARCAARYGF